MANNGYVGGLDIVGYDHVDGYDIVGGPSQGPAPVRGMAIPRGPGVQRGRPVAGMRGGEHVAHEMPDVARRQISPIPATLVPPGGTASVSFRPQRPIRIERLVLDAATVQGVFLTDLLIGADPQFVNAGAVPISVFQAQAFGTELRGNTAEPGIEITLSLLNTTVAPVTVGGCVIGTSLT
jgi:hypothetical protein